MKALVLLALLGCLVPGGLGMYYTRCQLAQTLQQLGLDGYMGYSLANWVCMAAHESSYNTQATHYNSWDGSTDFGIFQINSRYWCQNGDEYSSNICQIPCSDLLSNNLSVDVKCAKIIAQDSNGMSAWVAWKSYCQGQDLWQYVEGCGV
ncbi:lysozyme C-like [Gopherus flavomarginatus]|uniref:lysozyme C-like n=1 Tax=Gopherus flavomarginatus TaxID=286002 RepID=UPI0021CBF7FF|nr:lysozyme C-like [Gopherus flavomarginatus]